VPDCIAFARGQWPNNGSLHTCNGNSTVHVVVVIVTPTTTSVRAVALPGAMIRTHRVVVALGNAMHVVTAIKPPARTSRVALVIVLFLLLLLLVIASAVTKRI